MFHHISSRLFCLQPLVQFVEPSLRSPSVNASGPPILSNTPCSTHPAAIDNRLPSHQTSATTFRSLVHGNRHHINTKRCRPKYCNKIASLNIEGLTDAKLEELCLHMTNYNIGVLCLQETHKAGCPYYWYRGFLVILLGVNLKHFQTHLPL